MNVLSLFDGMSCGQIALNKLGIKYDNYFASEIDEPAMEITKKNYPDTIHIGDITKVTADDLPKIGLLIGGSPCQGFSIAGKKLNFDDPRSKLFFEYVRLLKECRPKNFLLENVKMKKEWKDIISQHMGVEPVEINGGLVSASNRKRLFWSNVEIPQPEDKGITIKDIITDDQAWFEDYVVERIQNWKASQKPLKNAKTIHDPKFQTLTARGAGLYHSGMVLFKEGEKYRYVTPLECERLHNIPEGYTAGVKEDQRYRMIGNGWTVDVITHIFKQMNFDD